ncbi:MAG: hypothetical protein JKY70_05010 [Mucilaginibacter sp.]|nr:hypothetical protein [Mucilaginibacter sp.]
MMKRMVNWIGCLIGLHEWSYVSGQKRVCALCGCKEIRDLHRPGQWIRY